MASDSRLYSLRGKLALALFTAALAGALLTGAATLLREPWWVSVALALLVLVPVLLWAAQVLAAPLREVLRALTSALASFRDGDFSGSIRAERRDELGELIEAHNELGSVLRAERHDLVQRELMLDTVIQNTPTALVLCDSEDHIVYGNVAARQQFNAGRKLEGLSFADVLGDCDPAVRTAVAARQDAIFSVALEGAEESFHLAQRDFSLRARPHRLYVFRRLTRELGRQEVATWKKAIRVISHELNNALAPISSLAHSGRELSLRGEGERLERVFDTIEERARYLHAFLQGYAAFAKLPLPRPEPVDWRPFLDELSAQYRYRQVGALPEQHAQFDRGQMTQVFSNLLKNAHESGSKPEDVSLSVRRAGDMLAIEVADRGSGMTETVMSNALVPFYSTKRTGTGLGLALAREIAEAHGGRIALNNREGGGLSVMLFLP